MELAGTKLTFFRGPMMWYALSFVPVTLTQLLFEKYSVGQPARAIVVVLWVAGLIAMTNVPLAVVRLVRGRQHQDEE